MTSGALHQPGDRVALYTADPGTRLRRGDQGTVTAWDPAAGQLDIRWDDGTTQSLRSADGDRLPQPPAGTTLPGPSGAGERVRAEITLAIRMGRKAVAEQTHYAARLSATARAALDDLDTRLAATAGYLAIPAEVMPVSHAIETACTRLRHASHWLQQTEDLAAILGITVPDDGPVPPLPAPDQPRTCIFVAGCEIITGTLADYARYWQSYDEHTDGESGHYMSETVTDRFGTRHVTEVTGDDGVFWCEDCGCYRDHGDGDPDCPGCTAAQQASTSGEDGDAAGPRVYRLTACGETAYAEGPR